MGVAAAKPGLQPLPAPPLPVPPLAVKERSDLLPARKPASGPARAGLADPRAIDFGPRAGTVPFPIQRHARVSAPSDAAELEAEDIGRRVAHMPLPALRPIAGGVAGTVQRRAVAPVAVSPAAVHAVEASRGGGAPLPAPVRQYMEPRFGADFGGVRLHTGPAAAQLATGLQANAFTYGRDIWFGAGQYRPDTTDGRTLIAHELAHTIQQGGVIQRSASAAPVVERSEAIHRSIWDDIRSGASSLVNALGDPVAFIADKANMIPGFRMLTIVLGVNPITMAPVAASPGNVLMALIEFIPGGGLVTQALQASGVFDKVGGWIADKVKGLVQAASAMKSAVTGFIASLSAKDIVDPGGVWDRAKRIFTEPVEKLIAFCKGVITDILKFIKEAVLLPVAKLAQGTDNWPLLVAVLGENPVTGEKVAPQPEVLIGGFMKLIGQDEIWQNMVAAKAVPRAWAWFQGAMAAVKGFVTAIPGKFKDLFGALTIEDLVTIVGAFKKVAGVFGGFVAGFLKWGLDAAIDLLKIVFDVVSPGAFDYVMKTGAALKGILKNPLPFVKNLIAAGKLGLSNFLGNFVEHLKAGLIDWLLGAVPGVYIPKALNLAELGQFAISILGLSWAQIRGKIVKALGPKGEAIMRGLELAFDVVKLLVTGGIPAVWNFIKEKLTNLKDMAIDAVVGFVKSAIIEKAIPKLLAMFVPGAGFISAIVSIWDTIKVFVEKLSTIAAVVKSYVDGIVAIAAGEIGGAAKKVEMGFRQMLTLAISFFAGFVGLGGIPAKVKGAVESLRGAVDHGLDMAITWLVGKAKALFASLFGGGRDKADKSKDPNALDVEEPVTIGDENHEVRAELTPQGLSIQMASTSYADFNARLEESKNKKASELKKLNLEAVVVNLNKDVSDIQSISYNGKIDPSMTKIERAAAERKMRDLLSILITKLKTLGITYKFGPGAAAKVGDVVRLDGNIGATVSEIGLQISSTVGIRATMNSGTIRLLSYPNYNVAGPGFWELVAPGKKPAFFPFTGSPGPGLRQVRGVDKLYPPGAGSAYADPPGLHAPAKTGALASERGHLVANMLGGPGGLSNIVAMTVAANHSGMKAFEDVARDAIVNKGQIVNYRATPNYSAPFTSSAPDSITVDFDIQDVTGAPVSGGKSGTVPN
jgi:hypothetical protein